MSDIGVSEVEDLTTSPARAGTSTRVADPHRSPLERGWAEVFANPKAKKKTKPLHPHGIMSGEAARKTAPITMPIALHAPIISFVCVLLLNCMLDAGWL